MKRNIRRGSATFRPRARIIRTLGRDLITNEVIALQELIKNSYDADAKHVTITFQEPLTPGEGAVVVADDGDGMTLETVRKAWMEPATISKVTQKKSRKGRRVTGEKGIGRFAAARVARVLDMTSIPRGGRSEIHVRFDWGAFDDEDLYLDEIKCRWEERSLPKRSKSGTVLRLIGLHDEWGEDKEKESFSTLRAELSRLISPLESPDKFEIELILPDRFKQLSGNISSPAILGKPHYKLSGKVGPTGEIDASYEGPGNGGPLQDNGAKPKIILSGGRQPSCGPFEFEFRVWDRSLEDLEPLAKEFGSTLRDLRRDLDAACGISIYRDRFRVLVPENDWLRLDLRRVQNPTMRVSNNQIVGMVAISADRNPGLKDQSNRQGIVDSPAFEDFKTALKELLSKLETKRDLARRATRPEPASGGIFQQLDFAPVRSYIEQRYPQDEELKRFLDQQAQSFRHGIDEVQQVVARYRRLATLGQLVDVILHEGRAPVATISNEIELARKDREKLSPSEILGKLPQRLETITRQTEFLAILFKRISPFSGRKRGRPVSTTFDRIIADAFALHEKRIRELKVNVTLPKDAIAVTVDEAEMQMILWNLLDNALYWLEKVPEEKRSITVETQVVGEDLRVIFSDSGPGVSTDIADRIFDPYFSTKPDGIGLGLTIAGETASEYDGSLELLADGPLRGATFRVILRKRIGATDA